MSHHPVVHSQQHKSNDDPEVWENILRDAGLPPEPCPIRNATPLPKDPSSDFVVEKGFFDRNSDAIFEAKQDWKKSAGYDFVCLFCGVHVYGAPKGTKYCCSNHRKRHDEGKTYQHIMCEADGCDREIFPVFDDVVTIEGKKLCTRCVMRRDAFAKVGVSTMDEFRALVKRKHDEYLLRSQEQQKQLERMYDAKLI